MGNGGRELDEGIDSSEPLRVCWCGLYENVDVVPPFYFWKQYGCWLGLTPLN